MDDNVLNLMRWAEGELERSDVPCVRKDAETLFMDSFSVRREDIYLMKDFKPTSHCLNLFRYYVKLRASRYPLQYILQHVEFMSLPFRIQEGVFIPRPETELLVETIIGNIKKEGKERVNPIKSKSTKAAILPLAQISNGVNILEIGTGCGNIAISLTKYITGCKIISSDISNKALKVAAKNARFHGVWKNIEFIKSALFDNLSSKFYNYFDIIITNPPYVRRGDLKHLEPEIFHEDVTALDGGEDGLYFYKRILNEGPSYLKKGGIFAFEIGYEQAADIAHLVRDNERLSEPLFFKDYNRHDRVVIIKWIG